MRRYWVSCMTIVIVLSVIGLLTWTFGNSQANSTSQGDRPHGVGRSEARGVMEWGSSGPARIRKITSPFPTTQPRGVPVTFKGYLRVQPSLGTEIVINALDSDVRPVYHVVVKRRNSKCLMAVGKTRNLYIRGALYSARKNREDLTSSATIAERISDFVMETVPWGDERTFLTVLRAKPVEASKATPAEAGGSIACMYAKGYLGISDEFEVYQTSETTLYEETPRGWEPGKSTRIWTFDRKGGWLSEVSSADAELARQVALSIRPAPTE